MSAPPRPGSFTTEDSITVKLGPWEPPTQYNRPQLEPSSEVRTKEHKVLGDMSIVQVLGENAPRFTLRGDGFTDDISRLFALEGEEVRLRHEIHTGDVLIEAVEAQSTGSYERTQSGAKWVYTYAVDLIKTD